MSATRTIGPGVAVATATLPFTGLNLAVISGIAAALLLAGFGLMYVARRKHTA
jgi:hypothetical protein